MAKFQGNLGVLGEIWAVQSKNWGEKWIWDVRPDLNTQQHLHGFLVNISVSMFLFLFLCFYFYFYFYISISIFSVSISQG